MMNPEQIRSQIEKLTCNLIEISLSQSQNYPSLWQKDSNITEISFNHSFGLSCMLKNCPYLEMFNELDKARLYNIKMIDGALLQLMYRFQKTELESHRLAFFPSPYLEEFQNNPDVYKDEAVFTEVVFRNIVPFPLRFDYDSRNEVFIEVHHPKSHLSLGQYKNCRIPVSSPLTPYQFICCVLRNFYNTAYIKFCENITIFSECFPETILGKEKELIYINVPKDS